MNEWLLLITLVIAIAIGFFLGRYRRRQSPAGNISHNNLNRDYFTGLRYLLNDQQDQAIATFMRVLEINPETVDTHIALGNLFRSKGETEKAIRLHQNLFARPTLSKPLTQQVQLELARDFFAAGLFDRAERLLQEIKDAHHHEVRLQAHQLLIRLYEQEKEWLKAIETGQTRLLKDLPEQQKAIAHYYCELAESLLSRDETSQARKYLKQALYNDQDCIRANWATAQLELKNGSVRKAKSLLLRIPEQDKRYYSLVLPELDGLMSHKEITPVLNRALETFPTQTALTLKTARIQQQHGEQSALEFLEAYAARNRSSSPYIAGCLVHLLQQTAEGSLQLTLQQITQQLERFQSKQHQSRCNQCGFKSLSTSLWQCPKCRQWGSIRPDDRL